MANGYIGKISAVVTANTSDLSRKLQGGIAEVDKFANRLSRSVKAASDSATASFGKIFTPLQRLERSFQGALNLNLRTESDINKLRSLVSVAEDINKPLEAAAKSFAGLSRTVAAEFQPALVRAQGQVQFIEKQFEIFGRISESTFNRVTRNVERTTVAINQLREASALVQSLPTGNELAFSDPRLAANLQAAQRAGRQAISLPAATIAADPQIEGLTRQIARVSELSVAAAARVKAAVTPSDLSAAKQEADRLNAALDSLIAKLNRKYQVVVDAQKAQAAADELKKTLDEIRSVQQFRITGQFQSIEQAKDALVEAIALSDKLSAGQRAAIQPDIDAAITAVESGDLDASLQAIQRVKAAAESGVRLNLQAKDARAEAEALDKTIGRLKENAEFVITGRPQNFDQVQAELNRILATLDKLDPAGRGGLSADITAVIDLIGQEDIAGATAALDALRKKAAGEIQIKVDAEAASDRIKALESTWIAALSGIPAKASEIDAQFQSLAVRISRLNLGERVNLEGLVKDFQASVAAGQPLIDQFQKLLALATAVDDIDGLGVGGRVGDVNRLGVDKLQLGFQQAAFAVDDFFSVTGDFQQRLRAVSNNVTQLGFILGSTEGLFLSLAAVIGAQAFIQLEKFANSNLDTADRVKTLNDALARQKSLVEELAEAYRSVADAIASSGLTSETRDLRDRNKLIDDLRKKQNEQQRERVAGLNREVQRERGIQAARQRELEATADPGERVRLEREIRQSRDRERLAADAAVARPGVTAVQAVEAAAEARFRAEAAAIEARAARAAGASGPGGQGQAAAELLRQRELAAAESRRAEFVAAGVGRVQGAGGARARAAEANRILDEAQQEIASSITTGFVGFFDGANQERRAQLARLEEERAQLEKDIFRSATNEVAIEATRTALEASAAIGAAYDVLADAIEAGSPAASSLARSLETLNTSILEAEARIQSAQEAGDVGVAEAARAQINAANAQKDALISAAQSVSTFADTLERISGELANTVASEARSAADQARRDANAAGPRDADFANSRRDRLERDARQAEDRAADIARQNRQAERRFLDAARGGRLGGDLQRAIAQRDEAQGVLDNRAATEAQRAAAIEARDRANRNLARAFEESPAGRAARNRSDELNRDQAARDQLDQDIRRGRELSLTEGQRAGRELEANLRAINANFDEQVRQLEARDPFADAAGINAQRQAAIEQARQDAFRATAPAIFGLADAVQNAILQGPSRAALEATDVSTVEGARELNRLLRGDDAARNQDLVQLQREANRLLQLIADGGGAGVANN